MRVTVCIPTVRPDTVADAVASIRAQTYSDWELIVVGQGDEGRIRSEVERAAGGDQRVTYVHIPRKGLSIARNVALDRAAGHVVAFTDDDCEADPDWLAQLVAAFQRYPEVGLVFGSLIKPAVRPTRFEICPAINAIEVVYDPAASHGHAPDGWRLVGANMSVRRDVSARIGYFDEQLGAGAHFPAAEETDYVLRAERLGVPMHSTPKVSVNHTHGVRYGLKAVYDHRRAYARGNAGLAAKLTLLGDPRGRAWMRNELRAATIEPIRMLRPHRIPVHLVRLWHFATAYRTCLRHYRANIPAAGGIAKATLQPIS